MLPGSVLVGDDTEVNGVRGVPDQHVGAFLGGPAVDRLVLMEVGEPGGLGPDRLVQVTVDGDGNLEPGGRGKKAGARRIRRRALKGGEKGEEHGGSKVRGKAGIMDSRNNDFIAP